MLIARREVLAAALALAPVLLCAGRVHAASFQDWVQAFRARARARGVSEATYASVMGTVTPDTSVYREIRNQPEFSEPVWKYINRRTSAWRVAFGKTRAQDYAALLARIEAEYGVDRFVMLGLWGMESAFGDLAADRRYMRPVIPALAALAYGEPRRRAYWEKELLNALVIIDRGWSTPQEMVGSWAGAMGHTQWMPEVWLNVGVDFNHDGRISPFGPPDDALAGTARYLLQRGNYRRGAGWGLEVDLPTGLAGRHGEGTSRTVAQWRQLGVKSFEGRPFPADSVKARLWVPVPGGPAFLLTQNFYAVRSYNPSSNYTLALVHLGDRIRDDRPFVRAFPGGERALTLAEMQELQARLGKLGYDAGPADGRAGRDTNAAVAAFQRKKGLAPADGYPGLQVLARLRQDTGKI